jgi:RimJ/RimL family protein N-acetyltransferase
MHLGNKDFLDHLKKTYPESFKGAVLELGSFDLNGSIRPWFKEAKKYVGIDIIKGKGVDIVCNARDTQFTKDEFDTLACFSMFEHDPKWKESFAHNLPWLKEGGMIFLCWGAEGNLHHGPEPWAIVPAADFAVAALDWPIEIIDQFFEPTRFTPDCPGAYDLIARKKTAVPPLLKADNVIVTKEPRVFSHKGLAFRLPEDRDLETIQNLRNDESTWIHLSDPKPVGPADQKAWLQSIGWKNGRMYFVVFDDQNPFIGLVRMDELDQQNRSLRVGLDVLPELRGKGFGSRTYEALKAYAFDQMNIHRLWLAVLDTNERAKKLYEKMGFKVEGRYRETIFRHGRFVDYVLMSILEGEYRSGATRK